MNRRNLLGMLMALPVFAVAGAGYTTPAGDEPIEVLCGGYAAEGRWVQRWREFPFDQLVPGDILRRKREPKQEYEVDDPYFWDGVGVSVTRLP